MLHRVRELCFLCNMKVIISQSFNINSSNPYKETYKMFKYIHLDLSIGLVFNVTSWVIHVEHNTSSTFLYYFSKALCNFNNSGGHSNSNNSVDLSVQSSCKYM